MKSNLQEKTIILDVIFHQPVLTRPDNSKRVETDGNQRWFKITKEILKSPAYTRLSNIATDAQEWLRKRAIPNPFIKRGSYQIPVSILQEVIDYLDEIEVTHRAQVNVFISEYDECKKKAQEELKDSYNEKNYPTTDYMRSGCWIERQILDYSTPDENKVGSVISQIALNEAKKRMNDATQQVVYALREQFRDLVSHLAEQLGTQADGKKKRLHESVVNSFSEWVDLFSKRNVMGDTEMQELVNLSKNILQGKSVTLLRDDEAIRSSIRESMNSVKNQLDGLLIDRPARRIRFED